MFQVLSFVALRGPVDKSGKCCQRGSHGGAHLGPAEWNCAATLWNGDSEKQDSSNFLEPGRGNVTSWGTYTVALG